MAEPTKAESWRKWLRGKILQDLLHAGNFTSRFGDVEKVTSLNHTYLCSGEFFKHVLFSRLFFPIKRIVFTKGLHSTHPPETTFCLKESWTFSSDSACFLGTCQFSFEDNGLIFVHRISRDKLCSIKLIQEPRDIGGAIMMVTRDLMYFPIKMKR